MFSTVYITSMTFLTFTKISNISYICMISLISMISSLLFKDENKIPAYLFPLSGNENAFEYKVSTQWTKWTKHQPELSMSVQHKTHNLCKYGTRYGSTYKIFRILLQL